MSIVVATLITIADRGAWVSDDIVLIVAMMVASFLAGVIFGVWVVPWLVDRGLFPFVRATHDRK
jgi:hypothetical protein